MPVAKSLSLPRLPPLLPLLPPLPTLTLRACADADRPAPSVHDPLRALLSQGERPDELDNGIDHLDKLETLGKSSKDLAFSDGFTGNKKLYNAKLNVGGKVDAARRGGADMDGRRNLENDSFFAEGNDGFGASRS